MRRALSGVTVVELAGGIAGAYCGKLFAGLGADVRFTDRDGERILIEWEPDAALIERDS